MRAVIIVEGGLVQEVLTDEPMDYIIIDKDVQDEDESCELIDTVGDKFTASITEYQSRADEFCGYYYNQIPAV